MTNNKPCTSAAGPSCTAFRFCVTRAPLFTYCGVLGHGPTLLIQWVLQCWRVLRDYFCNMHGLAAAPHHTLQHCSSTRQHHSAVVSCTAAACPWPCNLRVLPRVQPGAAVACMTTSLALWWLDVAAVLAQEHVALCLLLRIVLCAMHCTVDSRCIVSPLLALLLLTCSAPVPSASQSSELNEPSQPQTAFDKHAGMLSV